LVGISLFKDDFNDFDLLYNMPCGCRFNTGWQQVKLAKDVVKVRGIALDHLHGLDLFKPGLFRNLILPLICIVLQVSGIRNIAYIPHLVSQVKQVPVDHIKGHERSAIPQVYLAVDRRAADIHAHVALVQGFKYFLFTRK